MQEFHQSRCPAEENEAVRIPRAARHLSHSQVFLLIVLYFLLTPTATVHAQTGSWVRQQTGTLAWLHSIFFVNAERGWVVGSKGTLLVTVDGGKTWQLQPHPSN